MELLRIASKTPEIEALSLLGYNTEDSASVVIKSVNTEMSMTKNATRNAIQKKA